ncbi:MAG TPA: HlyD family secretion protein, partial [Steroidobacter sp.]|nr:HlyD family secretion protein [Steroidobacter sp.]
RDISHVHSGQNAVLRFSAFDQRSTPEFDGKVILVSPDITQDPRNGVQYYTIRVALSPGQDTRLEGRKLVAGMPVEAFIHTGTRSVISYLVKPIADQAARAFRE